MLPSMRTTLVLDDHLVRQAKERALAEGTTLSEITNRALREFVPAVGAAAGEEPPFRMPTHDARGGTVCLSAAGIAALRDDGR